MRFVIPYVATADNFQENVAHCLRRMGHDVFTLPAAYSRWAFSRWGRLLTESAERLGWIAFRPAERWLLNVVKRSKPDVLLALTQQISNETLEIVGSHGVRRVAWWGDSPANMKRQGLLTKEWDAVFLKDPMAVEKFRMAGMSAELLHEAMNPTWHRPVKDQENGSIVVAGNYYGYRQALVSRLLHHGVPLALYGNPPPKWSKPEIQKAFSGEYLVKERKSECFGAGLACLNSTSLKEGNSLNCRAFEIAGAGGLQLLEDRPIVRECFEPGIEVLTFSTFQELLGHIERARRFPKEMKEIREAAARRALSEHTYKHRLVRIIDSIS